MARATMRNTALIVAAGKGERAGVGLPKQFARLGGKTLVAHTIDSFAQHPAIDGVYVVIGAGQHAQFAAASAGCQFTQVVTGGAERQESVRAGLDAIAADGGTDAVFIHDAARPLLPRAVIDRLAAALESHDGAVPVLPLVDTIAQATSALGDTIDRQAFVRVQTPQAFRFDAIAKAHAAWSGPAATDDAQMARAAGFLIAMVEGDPMLDKITHPADFETAEARLGRALISRTGLGFDVHRLQAGLPLWLGGVLIPHEMGLSGHSDADVALHAIVDALLGAIGEGDIGTHFPPSDPQWQGAASSHFVAHVRELISARGGIIDHIDLTIICEAPKIGPHRSAMRNAIASILYLDAQAISIKATTTEGLGFTGRGEGIAAQAIATVRS
jgi:2-C-methyl-D-erythritol 4-phosphate cytidylyltransferase / 2-C-methyl-D-erythritol 2,4-cyclodiphosphate synthase